MYLAYIFGGKFRILRLLNKVLFAVVVILFNNLKSSRKETFCQFFFAISPIEKTLKTINLACDLNTDNDGTVQTVKSLGNSTYMYWTLHK